MATRNGSAKWTGDLKAGSGELTVGEGVWTSAYSDHLRKRARLAASAAALLGRQRV
jgi:hypothetical protein